MLELSRSERSVVEAALRATRDRRHWVRLRGVLLAAEGVPIADICRDLGCVQSSIYDWLAHWRRTRDPAALDDAPRSGQPPVLKAEHRVRLEQLLGEEPETHGYKTVGWTVPLLAVHFAEVEGVPVSETTLRRAFRARRPPQSACCRRRKISGRSCQTLVAPASEREMLARLALEGPRPGRLGQGQLGLPAQASPRRWRRRRSQACSG